MLRVQCGRCAVCRTDQPGGGKPVFQVDHNHKTGEIRGLLCSRCNQLLGYAQDSTRILRAAQRYLSVSQRRKRSSKPTSKLLATPIL
jgi:uncharacterized C2H2 Zn-finger protein